MKNNTTIVKATLLNNTATLASNQLSQVIEQISEMSNDDTISLYNDMADSNGYDRIYDNDEYTLNELFMTPYDAIRQTNNKDYNDNDNYFTFNGYGHAISFDYRLQDNSPIDIEELAQWIIDNELYNEYDIEVTTLDDMLASIEDNITDDENLTYKLANYINESYDSDDSVNDVAQWCIVTLYDYDYNQLNDIITLLGIDYE